MVWHGRLEFHVSCGADHTEHFKKHLLVAQITKEYPCRGNFGGNAEALRLEPNGHHSAQSRCRKAAERRVMEGSLMTQLWYLMVTVWISRWVPGPTLLVYSWLCTFVYLIIRMLK